MFREVRRVLRDDGVLWVNLGDAYAADRSYQVRDSKHVDVGNTKASSVPTGLKPGDLTGLPFRVVSALQADGWWWRATVVVAKKNPMPESVQSVRWERHRVKAGRKPVSWREMPKGWDSGEGSHDEIAGGNYAQAGSREATVATWQDCPGCPTCSPNDGLILRHGSWRVTTAHEFVFMLTKSQRYWADGEAVREAHQGIQRPNFDGARGQLPKSADREDAGGNSVDRAGNNASGRNLRSVLTLATQPYAWAMCKACQEIYSPERFRRLHRDNGQRVCACGAKDWLSHYATFPEALVEPLIKASTSERGCCQTCGAGWARVVERGGESTTEKRKRLGGFSPKRGAGGAGITQDLDYAGGHGSNLRGSNTLDWRPTCACPPLPPVPAVVLDPFSGAGTVAFVAVKLGRKGIGVDLSWEYSRMAEARIAKGESWDPPAVPEGQMTLGV